jgi:hypothetical protein
MRGYPVVGIALASHYLRARACAREGDYELGATPPTAVAGWVIDAAPAYPPAGRGAGWNSRSGRVYGRSCQRVVMGQPAQACSRRPDHPDLVEAIRGAAAVEREKAVPQSGLSATSAREEAHRHQRRCCGGDAGGPHPTSPSDSSIMSRGSKGLSPPLPLRDQPGPSISRHEAILATRAFRSPLTRRYGHPLPWRA